LEIEESRNFQSLRYFGSLQASRPRCRKINRHIEIEDAGTFIDLSRLEVSALPVADLIFSKKAA